VWSPSRAAAQRAAKRISAFYSSLNLWPFVGIMIALLFMFLANTSPIHGRWGAPVDRARSFHAVAQPGALREDAMKVYVTRDGNVFFGPRVIALNELTDRVRGALREGAEKRIYLSVDARSRYGDAVVVAFVCRGAL
jgi:biopolymer transport protein ExbD